MPANSDCVPGTCVQKENHAIHLLASRGLKELNISSESDQSKTSEMTCLKGITATAVAVVALLPFAAGVTVSNGGRANGHHKANIQELSLRQLGSLPMIEAPPSLFNIARSFSQAPPVGVHPRVLFNQSEWDQLVSDYAANAKIPGWHKHFLDFTYAHGPGNKFTPVFENLNFSVGNKTLAGYFDVWGYNNITRQPYQMNEYSENAIFQLTLHAFVETKVTSKESPVFARVILILENWARVVNAHGDLYDCYEPSSPVYMRCTPPNATAAAQNSDAWTKTWTLATQHAMGLFGIAMSYDVMYNRMSVSADLIKKRNIISGAIARIVRGRRSWGMGLSDQRLVSNWGPYIGTTLFLANYAIEGEGHDPFILTEGARIMRAYMMRGLYPDGAAAEDGYVPSIAFRESGNMLVALARRGENLLDSQVFRNFLFHVSQMYEPWFCGNYIGHASGDGGGDMYQSVHALGRYVYPNGSLPKMLWRQKVGDDYAGEGVCRADWFQTMNQVFLFGGNHINAVKDPGALGAAFPLYHFSPWRGLLLARSSRNTTALYIHFDGRGDCFQVGHDNADRGGFTLTSHGKTWIPDRPWNTFFESYHHSLMHVDGYAQERRAPCVNMLKSADDGSIVIAAANLTNAYSTQWYPAWPDPSKPDSWFSSKGWAKETRSPAYFGWPTSAYDAAIGLPQSMWGDPNFGFAGMYTWRKPYRSIDYSIRSTVLARNVQDPNAAYFMVVDKAAVGDGKLHTYELLIAVANDVYINASMSTVNMVALSDGTQRQLDVHIASKQGSNVSYEIKTFPSSNSAEYSRSLSISTRAIAEEFWIVFHPHTAAGAPNDTGVTLVTSSTRQNGSLNGTNISITVSTKRGNTTQRYVLDSNWTVVQTFDASPQPSPSSSPSASSSSTPSSTPSASRSVTPSASPSLSASPSSSPRPIGTATATALQTARSSPSPSLMASRSSNQNPTAILTPSPNASSRSNPTPSAQPSPSSHAGPTASPSPKAQPSPSPKASPSPNPTPSAQPNPSPRASPSANSTPSAQPSPSPKASQSSNPTPSAKPSPSPKASPSPNRTPSAQSGPTLTTP